MLKLFNLEVLDKIFASSKARVGSSARMLYINFLTHYFRDKKPSMTSAAEFTLLKRDIPGVERYERQLQELDSAGLIRLSTHSVYFPDCWLPHLDQRQLRPIDPYAFAGLAPSRDPVEFTQQLKTDQQLYEIVCMQHRIPQATFYKLIEVFLKEQTAFKKKYENYEDVSRHAYAWMAKNQHKIPRSGNKSQQPLGE